MKAYLDILKDIYELGFDHPDRTGTGRRSLFGKTIRLNMADGFPIITTRKINYNAAFKEMFWFIRGDSNVKQLHEQNVHIWDQWAVNSEFLEKQLSDLEQQTEVGKIDSIRDYVKTAFEGSIGPMYGYVWRHAPVSKDAKKLFEQGIAFEDIASDKLALFQALYEQEKNNFEKEIPSFEDFAVFLAMQKVDQLQNLLLSLKRNPFSARHVMTAWIPEYLPVEGVSPKENVLFGKGALAPCHAFVQCFVTPGEEGNKNKLSLYLYQRSADFPVGSCFNIAQYALLLHLLAHCTEMDAHELIYTTGDTHIYLDQLPLIEEQLSREPLPLPTLKILTQEKDLFKIRFEDIVIENYQSHPAIKYPVSE